MWEACRPLPGRVIIGTDIPVHLQADLPDDSVVEAVIAGQESVSGDCQAVLRRRHDVVNLSVAYAASQYDPTRSPGPASFKCTWRPPPATSCSPARWPCHCGAATSTALCSGQPSTAIRRKEPAHPARAHLPRAAPQSQDLAYRRWHPRNRPSPAAGPPPRQSAGRDLQPRHPRNRTPPYPPTRTPLATRQPRHPTTRQPPHYFVGKYEAMSARARRVSLSMLPVAVSASAMIFADLSGRT
jgi:hypothetical protein